ncbi:MAG: hypothetical protein JST37_08185 [Bacteroidetes bacterium]|nr:hypothetical protein [Bacteroidota bacterium]MBS1982445.1 hypothetical protein [Bacteroidota bacterium]
MNSSIKYFAVLMSLLYILIGAMLVWGKEKLSISSTYSLPIGLTLIIYGLFRSYRIYQKYFS